MSRITIDVTSDQHKRLKAIAALSGQSLKDYVLEKLCHQKRMNRLQWMSFLNISSHVLRKPGAAKLLISLLKKFFKKHMRIQTQITDYDITPEAKRDLKDIVRYTDQMWGRRQTRIYERKLIAGFDKIGRGNFVERQFKEVGSDIF